MRDGRGPYPPCLVDAVLHRSELTDAMSVRGSPGAPWRHTYCVRKDMARNVAEIMNTELFTLRPDDTADLALRFILDLGISGAPVVDEARTVLGHASTRDLLAASKGPTVAERMATNARTVDVGMAVDEAARRMVDGRVHQLIVVDAGGRAVGVVSAVDIVAALVGLPIVHHPTSPQFDRAFGIAWTDQAQLKKELVSTAPEAPGVFVLIEGAAMSADRVVWAEGGANIRSRLFDLLSSPQDDETLAELLTDPERLRFRAAAIPDPGVRLRALEFLRASIAPRRDSFRCETDPRIARPLPNLFE